MRLGTVAAIDGNLRDLFPSNRQCSGYTVRSSAATVRSRFGRVIEKAIHAEVCYAGRNLLGPQRPVKLFDRLPVEINKSMIDRPQAHQLLRLGERFFCLAHELLDR